MSKPVQNLKSGNPAGYVGLLNEVRKTLLEGQSKIEQAKVQTYWQTGRLINLHVLKYSGNNADYGNEVVIRLGEDLALSESVLYRCVKFNQTYPDLQKVARGPLFKWSHYRKLITIQDGKKRSWLEEAARKNGWTVEELTARIKEQYSGDGQAAVPALAVSAKPSGGSKPLVPLRGVLYTYRLIERPGLSVATESGLLVDLGFGVYHEAEPRLLSGFNIDEIVESCPKEDTYKFYKTGRTAKDLFTYAAYVEKVIDGDTLKVRLDLGFKVWMRETLRLRGIDCPEVGTPKGDEARNFVRSHLKEAQLIVVRSSRPEKYDRYLADVYIPQEGTPDSETDVYLNNLLLENGYAVRMG